MADPIDELAAMLSSTPPIPVSEDAAATALRDRYCERLRYCADDRTWYVWDGSLWRADKSGQVKNLARGVARDLGGGSIRTGSANFTKGVETLAKADPAFATLLSDFDADPLLLGSPGGTVDLKTGKLIAANPAQLISKSTTVTPAPDDQCSLWLQFIDEVTGGDKALARFLQQWAGYCLTGETREQKLFFGYGSGGNGKGVFSGVLTAIAGSYATTAPMSMFEASKFDRHPTDLAMLRGARLVTASETEADKAWAEGRIKTMTGGDLITARFMRGDFFTYLPQFKLTIFGNHPPVLRNVDDAIRRRLIMVPFGHKPAQPDPSLPEKLRAEYPAILRWMVNGCIDWLENGLILPTSVEKASKDYFEAQDIFADWLSERCIIDMQDTQVRDARGPLLTSWNDYRKACGELPESSRGFAGRMRAQGFKSYRTKTTRYFQHVRLLNVAECQVTHGDTAISYGFE